MCQGESWSYPNTHQPKTPAQDSVGARVVERRGEGLYGRPSCLVCTSLPDSFGVVPTPGTHKGPTAPPCHPVPLQVGEPPRHQATAVGVGMDNM